MTPIYMKRPEDAADAFQYVWNNHDMVAFAALFQDNATFVNRFGRYVRGVWEIIDLHRPNHETIYRDSSVTGKTNSGFSFIPKNSPSVQQTWPE
jgi:hypothetical protein